MVYEKKLRELKKNTKSKKKAKIKLQKIWLEKLGNKEVHVIIFLKNRSIVNIISKKIYEILLK